MKNKRKYMCSCCKTIVEFGEELHKNEDHLTLPVDNSCPRCASRQYSSLKRQYDFMTDHTTKMATRDLVKGVAESSSHIKYVYAHVVDHNQKDFIMDTNPLLDKLLEAQEELATLIKMVRDIEDHQNKWEEKKGLK